MQYGIPVKGTHAHSWVMSFDSEDEAFNAYADALPNNVVLLVDTYDTIQGVKKATEVAKKLKNNGHDLLGIRLDSGDLTKLSIDAREILDDAGLHDAKIIASNDLDEHSITELKNNGARIDIWGIGTKLATCYDQPALGGVYKLGEIQNHAGEKLPKVKLSNDPIKVSNPGTLQVARHTDQNGNIIQDIIYDELKGLDTSLNSSKFCNLLQPALRSGKRVLGLENLSTIRTRAQAQWQAYKNNDTPTNIDLDSYVADIKKQLIAQNQ